MCSIVIIAFRFCDKEVCGIAKLYFVLITPLGCDIAELFILLICYYEARARLIIRDVLFEEIMDENRSIVRAGLI